jgi:hypothetical protein
MLQLMPALPVLAFMPPFNHVVPLHLRPRSTLNHSTTLLLYFLSLGLRNDLLIARLSRPSTGYYSLDLLHLLTPASDVVLV